MASNKRRLHHWWTYFRLIHPWYFLVACLLCLALGAYQMRQNYKHMVVLRDAVYTADKDNGDVEGSLQKLRAYVNSHMNTDLASGPNAVHPPIQLKYTYQRLSSGQPNTSSPADVYADAEKYCEATIPDGLSGRFRLECVKTYVNNHQAVTDPTAAPTIPKNLYQFDFASPRWSPDLAGWSLAASAGFGLLFVISFVSRKLFRQAVR